MKHFILSIFMLSSLLSSCSTDEKRQTLAKEDSNTNVIEATQTANSAENSDEKVVMYPELSAYIESVIAETDEIPLERKDELKKIALYVQTKKQTKENANLTFICTHNSRRSHMSQIWAATAAAYYGIAEGVHTYSGGTETTAFNPRAVAAMERAGFRIKNPGGENPHYQVNFSAHSQSLECFSKKYDDTFNAQENFVAIMTCSQADKNCPLIPGATLRVPIPYEDPKVADGTDQETARYDERCRQIATEMFYLMSQVQA
ncbi:protein-tyrosine-phosphatase [Porifericola rhodea]|uniref:arsenate reductase/protein-tyrosine-phosphatase family protein n=1 Tax=Porifericola rhodea TaxID=930972 RepID=UPI0026657D1F|nr:protein-tyrosine-phosphatase [Porifericola rhodea]WKN30295.1 protein-tyrosine-phosphatase [Porifericola rhodea]